MSIFNGNEYDLRSTLDTEDTDGVTYITSDDPNGKTLYFDGDFGSGNIIDARIINGVWEQVDFAGHNTVLEINNPKVLNEMQKMYEQETENKIKVLIYFVADFIINNTTEDKVNDYEIDYSKLIYEFDDIKIWSCGDVDSEGYSVFKIEQKSIGEIFIYEFSYSADEEYKCWLELLLEILLSTIC